MKSFKTFCEDAGAGAVPVNTAGSGAVHGIGVGPKGEPGVKVSKTLKKKPVVTAFSLLRRKSVVK